MVTVERFVVQVGATTAAAASAAARTRRAQQILVASPAELTAILAPDMRGSMIAALDLATVGTRDVLDVVRAAAERAPDLALGLLCGWGETALIVAAERLPAEPSVAPPDGIQRVFNSLAHEVPLSGARLCDGNAKGGSPEGVHALLTQPVELLFLIGHSNGVDMSVGGTLLCRQPVARTDSNRTFPCFHGTDCARTRFGFHRGEPVLAVDRLQARRAVCLSCWGVAPDGALFEPSLTLGESLLAHVGVEALITTVRASLMEPPEARYLYYLCNSGLPFGAVAARANRWRIERGFPPDFVCFGDPETRMTDTLWEATLELDGSTCRVGVPDEGGAIDVRVHLPSGSSYARAVILDLSLARGAAVLAPEGTVYASIPAARSGAPAFLVIDKEYFADYTDVVRRLAREAPLWRLLAQGAGARIGAGDPRVVALSTTLADLDALIAGWPLSRVPPGAALRSVEIGGLIGELAARLRLLAEAGVDLYIELIRRLGSFNPSFMWRHAYDHEGLAESALACGGCGGIVDVQRLESKSGAAAREVAFCLACGPVLEGGGVGELQLRITEPPRAGSILRVQITARNSYPVSVPMYAAAGLALFLPEAEPPVAQGHLESVPPGEVKSIDLELRIPAGFRPGVHYLGCTQVIGGAVAFHRVPLVIQANASEPAPVAIGPLRRGQP
jgi:hypothetical protein